MPRHINNFQESNFDDPRLLRRYDRWIDRSNTRYQAQTKLPPDADAATIAKHQQKQAPPPQPVRVSGPPPVANPSRSQSRGRTRLYYDPKDLSAAMLRQEKRSRARAGAQAKQPLTFAEVWQVEHKAAQIWNSKLGTVSTPRNPALLPAPYTTTDEVARGLPPVENADVRGYYSPYVWREGVAAAR